MWAWIEWEFFLKFWKYGGCAAEAEGCAAGGWNIMARWKLKSFTTGGNQRKKEKMTKYTRITFQKLNLFFFFLVGNLPGGNFGGFG